MLEFIRGRLVEVDLVKNLPKIIVENGGLGYQILLPINQFSMLPALGSPLFLYLSFIVREDAHTLYGFLHKQERSLFITLSDLSGVGPRTALTILGNIAHIEFIKAILANDITRLVQIPSVGKKTAERLIIELKDRFMDYPLGENKGGIPFLDAVRALTNLGYDRSLAEEAVLQAKNALDVEMIDLSSLVKISLQNLRKR